MFKNISTLLPSSNLSSFNVENIINMNHLFYDCQFLEELPDISKWNTINVRNMNDMFNNCSSLKFLPDISNWKTCNLMNMNNMFSNCKSLENLPDISQWNTSNVIDISHIFSNCSLIKELPDICKWDMNNAKYMSCIFYECNSLKSLPDISNWNINKVINKKDIFEGSIKPYYNKKKEIVSINTKIKNDMNSFKLFILCFLVEFPLYIIYILVFFSPYFILYLVYKSKNDFLNVEIFDTHFTIINYNVQCKSFLNKILHLYISISIIHTFIIIFYIFSTFYPYLKLFHCLLEISSIFLITKNRSNITKFHHSYEEFIIKTNDILQKFNVSYNSNENNTISAYNYNKTFFHNNTSNNTFFYNITEKDFFNLSFNEKWSNFFVVRCIIVFLVLFYMFMLFKIYYEYRENRSGKIIREKDSDNVKDDIMMKVEEELSRV